MSDILIFVDFVAIRVDLRAGISFGSSFRLRPRLPSQARLFLANV